MKASRGKRLEDLGTGTRRKSQAARVSGGRKRPAAGASQRAKNPRPVSGAGSSTLCGLFHPNACTVTHACCTPVSKILNLS
jgi:hypothetical protein